MHFKYSPFPPNKTATYWEITRRVLKKLRVSANWFWKKVSCKKWALLSIYVTTSSVLFYYFICALLSELKRDKENYCTETFLLYLLFLLNLHVCITSFWTYFLGTLNFKNSSVENLQGCQKGAKNCQKYNCKISYFRPAIGQH